MGQPPQWSCWSVVEEVDPLGEAGGGGDDVMASVSVMVNYCLSLFQRNDGFVLYCYQNCFHSKNTTMGKSTFSEISHDKTLNCLINMILLIKRCEKKHKSDWIITEIIDRLCLLAVCVRFVVDTRSGVTVRSQAIQVHRWWWYSSWCWWWISVIFQYISLVKNSFFWFFLDFCEEIGDYLESIWRSKKWWHRSRVGRAGVLKEEYDSLCFFVNIHCFRE